MNKSRQFLLILALSLTIILLSVFLVFKLSFSGSNSLQVEELIPSPSPAVSQQNLTRLYFSEPKVTGKKLTTSLVLDPKTEKVAAVDVVLTYDSEVFLFLNSQPGNFFQNPLVLKKEISKESGRLRFALGSQTVGQQTGSLVDLTFQIKNNYQGPIEIKILREETKIGAINRTGNVLGEAVNLLYNPVSR